jgi:hypothetical protein
MDRRTKATLHRDRAAQLLKMWNVAVEQARYSDDGHWYAALSKFPAALVDANGYLVFRAEDEYRRSPHIAIGKQISVPKPGISAVPGYIRAVSAPELSNVDLDVHSYEATEGLAQLRIHVLRERDRNLVWKKKAACASLACEVCGFSFAAAYGSHAASYCEVHHLVPLGQAAGKRRTTLGDLAVLCANCHSVVHLRNPPLTLQEIQSMLRAPE